MDFRYENFRDATMQLDNTVMMSARGVVFLQHYDGWDFRVRTLEDYDMNTEDIREIGLTFEPLQLGYVNYGRSIAYVVRNPRRMWKQGLSYDNLKATYGNLEGDFLEEPAFANTINGEYPSVKTAYTRCKVNEHNCAFSRDLAFVVGGEHIEIHYKGMPIGMLKEGDMHINDKFFYLKELIEEAVK